MRFESLLNYYQDELEFLVEGGKTFATQYPALAKTLDFSSFNSNDPDVQRLIESIAFLNAKLQKRLDEQAPEISQQILNAIYPQFLAPIPSITIMQFGYNAYSNDILTIPKNTNVTTKNESENKTYNFATTMETQIAPWEITDIFLTSISETKLPYKIYANCDNAIVITLNQIMPKTSNELVLYIHMNDKVAFDVYEAIMSIYPDQNTPVFEDEKEIGEIEPMGMDDESNLLPITEHENSAYRILLEYNIFHKKFLFFRIKFKQPPKEKIIIPFYSKKEIFIKKGNFLLNCTPAVNLFEKNSEPIIMDNTTSSYKIISDNNSTNEIDIHTLFSIHDTKDNKQDVFVPYFSCNHMLDTKQHIFWLINKKLNKQQTQYETTVSFISDNINFNNRILYAKLLCYQQNANAFVAKESSWNAPNNLGNINCINLERPTQSYMPILNSRSQWRLISHLSIDHFGFENSNTLKYIKELLAIYDFQNLNNKNAMNYLKELKYEIDMVSYNRCLVPKANLIIKADDVYSSPVFLLSHIIGKFFSQIMNFNTKFDVILKKNSNDKTWKKWNLI